MSYTELWKEAEKEKTVVDISPVWKAFAKEGDFVLGKLMGSSEVASSMGAGTYLQYLMDTDEGLIKFSLGAASDRELKTVLESGRVYKITYGGQIKIKGGRNVNQFKVMATEAPGAVSFTPGDVPF